MIYGLSQRCDDLAGNGGGLLHLRQGALRLACLGPLEVPEVEVGALPRLTCRPSRLQVVRQVQLAQYQAMQEEQVRAQGGDRQAQLAQYHAMQEQVRAQGGGRQVQLPRRALLAVPALPPRMAAMQMQPKYGERGLG